MEDLQDIRPLRVALGDIMGNLAEFWKTKVDFELLFQGQNAQVEEANYPRTVAIDTDIVLQEGGITLQRDWFHGIFSGSQREEALQIRQVWDFANLWPRPGEEDRSVYWQI